MALTRDSKQTVSERVERDLAAILDAIRLQLKVSVEARSVAV